MSLATRCTACGTVFRVVQDQLKVSEGWVRCGRCDEVFNALEGLFDLEREAPPEGISSDEVLPADEASPPSALLAPQAPAAPPDQPPAASASDPHHISGLTDEALDEASRASHRLDEALFASRPGEPDTQLAESYDSSIEQPGFSDARHDPELLTDEAALRAASGRKPHAANDQAPEFLREAERAARWRQPGVRALLAVLVLLLGGVLAAQMAHHFRDTVAARWPQTRTALNSWCALAGCQVESPRRIEDISVESTTLARATTGEGFRFAVNLRNRGSLPLAVPAVDLSLTDGSGQLVVRRVLTPQDFGVANRPLVAGADTSLQLMLSTGSTLVSGYTVEVFYP